MLKLLHKHALKTSKIVQRVCIKKNIFFLPLPLPVPLFRGQFLQENFQKYSMHAHTSMCITITLKEKRKEKPYWQRTPFYTMPLFINVSFNTQIKEFLKRYKTAGIVGTTSLTAQHQWTKRGGSSEYLAFGKWKRPYEVSAESWWKSSHGRKVLH